MNKQAASKGQAGFVSLFTVIFFMILVSIITLGFLRIMGLEQRQATDNDLSASALAAAESGIEDAKRAILKYTNLPAGDTNKATLRGLLTSSSCNALSGSTYAQTQLGISPTGQVGQSGSQQAYTCLSVNLDSPDYVGSSSAGKSEFIPLKTVSGVSFDQVKLSWHLLSEAAGQDGDGRPQNYAATTAFPQVSGDSNSWSSRGYPAYVRVQLYGYPNGSFDKAALEQRSHSVFLAPGPSSGIAAPISIFTDDPRGFDQNKTPVRLVRCEGTPPSSVPIGNYACSATLQLPAPADALGSNNTNYYLRVTPIYGNTHFKVNLQQGATAVNFSEVQPIIDVTGKANDVFRRVQARVRLDPQGNPPEFEAETADDICKNMEVSDGSYYQPNNCP